LSLPALGFHLYLPHDSRYEPMVARVAETAHRARRVFFYRVDGTPAQHGDKLGIFPREAASRGRFIPLKAVLDMTP
jgi:hypothetical protein